MVGDHLYFDIFAEILYRMKISVITMAACLLSISAFGQVGINTQTPAATLDVTARTTGTSTTTAEGLIAPRLTITDLNAKASAYGAAQAGSLIYVTDAANGIPAGQTANINAAGYYFFDGTGWLKVTTGNGGGSGSSGSSNDIYTGDGALTANRTVALSDKTLAFTANPTTGTSHFTVDDNTLSVDALNDKVGIGTSVPAEKLHVENGNMFMHHDSPTLYFQSTIPDTNSSYNYNYNSNQGSIVFYKGVNSTTDGMYMRHVGNPTAYEGGNHLQFGSIEGGTYYPIMNIANLLRKVMIGTNVVPTGGYQAKLIVSGGTSNGTTNPAIQIIDGKQGAKKVLMSDAYGVGSWTGEAVLTAPSTVYTWDNSGASGTLGYYQHYKFGPYTVGKTGWYMIQSDWKYQQSYANGDNGLGTVQIQINTSSGNTMLDYYNNASILDLPADETLVLNGMRAIAMLSGKMIYLTTNRNYFVHVESNTVDVNGIQRLKLNYVQ